MRNHLLVAGIAAAALIPTFAFAQTSCEQQHENRVAGTVAGGVVGALLGSAIAGHGDKTTGAVIGGVGGAVIGNQVSKGGADCAHAYGYYDTKGAWHANAVARTDARGYYDRSGRWIEGAPNGAYDSRGTWVAANSQGYYDNQGGWTPAATTGYWNTRGQWVAATPSAYDRAANASYDNRTQWDGAATDFRSRAAWLDEKIQRGIEDGSLSRRDGRRAERSLREIRRQEGSMRHYHGQLRPADEATIQARLDGLRQNIRWTRQNNARND
jgi:hypothetical protein